MLDQLELGGESSTLRRLARSRHVGDLRIIVNATVITALIIVLASALIGIYDHDTLMDGAKLTGGILVVAGGIVGWAYQAGSKRLGVVDLIASEIVTLCRVTYLIDVVPNLIKQYQPAGPMPSSPASIRFNSGENYFTVYESNSSDLQVLEATVLNNVAAFYTYMKGFRDTMRTMMDMRSSSAAGNDQNHSLINVVYMIFLAHESARNAIDDLIEDKPVHAENTMLVLYSEMPAYSFLLGKFGSDDPRQKRLELRRDSYSLDILRLQDRVRDNTGTKWEKAAVLLPDLLREYKRLNFGPALQ